MRPNSKKAQEEAARQHRETFAQDLFHELNRTVFKNGLPSVQLIWSKTLNVTAGRASFRRHRDQSIETKIELATKVLDSEERIKHT